MSTTAQRTTVPQDLTGTWVFDPVHSAASFAVKHMIVATFRAGFTDVDATLDADDDQLRLTGKVGASSVDVRDDNFRAHLLSAEFFDVENHPDITFASTDLRRDGDRLEVEGDLTVKGITRPVTAIGAISGPATDAFGGERVGIALETIVDRTAFDLNWNAPLPSGGVAVANDVTLVVELEFKQGE